MALWLSTHRLLPEAKQRRAVWGQWSRRILANLKSPFTEGKKSETFQRLATQLKSLDVSFTEDFESDLKNTHHVVDAIFGMYNFSFVHLYPSYNAIWKVNLRSKRLQFFRRSARTLSIRHFCSRKDIHPGHFRRCTFIMEHWRWSPQIWAGNPVPSNNTTQLDSA